jgi:hypothetical protein
MEAGYPERCFEQVASSVSWPEFIGRCQHNLQPLVEPQERLPGQCPSCLYTRECILFQTPLLATRSTFLWLTASGSLAGGKRAVVSCWANQSLSASVLGIAVSRPFLCTRPSLSCGATPFCCVTKVCGEHLHYSLLECKIREYLPLGDLLSPAGQVFFFF